MRLSAAAAFVVIWALFTQTGCASNEQFPIKYFAKGAPTADQGNEAIVFGRLVIIDNGLKQDFQKPFPSLPDQPSPVSLDVNGADRKAIANFKVARDGRFRWIVPRERSEIHKVIYRAGAEIQPQAFFRPPDDVAACYVGTLQLDILTERDALFFLRVEKINGILLQDEFEEEEKDFVLRHPEYSGKVGKCLLEFDKTIPLDPPVGKLGILLAPAIGGMIH